MELFDILRYEYNKVQDISIDTKYPDFTPVNSVVMQQADPGVYEVGVSIKWTLNTASSSGILRYSLDGGTTWYEAWEEPKDRTDDRHAYYAFPIEVTATQDIDFRVEMAKEASNPTMFVRFCDVFIKRVQ